MTAWTGPKLRVGTIGCGRMGAQTAPAMARHAPAHLRVLSHLEAVRSLGMASELAACDVSADALDRARQAYDLDYTTSDYNALITDFRPDLLTVATRTPEKTVILEAAVRAGVRAVHVEKPLCNSAAELEQVEALLDAGDLLLTSGCLRRYLPAYAGLDTMFSEQGLGVPTSVTMGMGLAPLMWTQFHAIDLILFLAGDRQLAAVQATLGPVEWDHAGKVVENDPLVMSATLIFDDGFTGLIGQSSGNTTIVSAPAGQVELFADGRSVFIGKRLQEDDPYLTKHAVDLHLGQLSGSQAPIWALARALQGEESAIRQVSNAGRDFIRAQLVALAFVESDRQGGRRIDMRGFTTDLTILGRTGGRFA
jgi:Predicted dehydrogenases and related proteins